MAGKSRITDVQLQAMAKSVDVSEAILEIRDSVQSIEEDSWDLRGLASDKPNADEVAVGTTYWTVDSTPQIIELSDGATWLLLGEK